MYEIFIVFEEFQRLSGTVLLILRNWKGKYELMGRFQGDPKYINVNLFQIECACEAIKWLRYF